MSDFDDLIRQLATNDTKKKLTVGQKVIDYLGDPENPVECEDLAGFIDSLVPWMQSSNFKARSLLLAHLSPLNILHEKSEVPKKVTLAVGYEPKGIIFRALWGCISFTDSSIAIPIT